MTGKQRYQQAANARAERKEDRVQTFSGTLGITTNAENQVEVPGRPGFVWVQLRNQLNETIQAFNESVSPVFGLPVLVEWDKDSPIRYKVRGRDIGRYTVWVTTNAAGDTVSDTSAYLPAHGASHSFNKLTGVGGGDIVWVYSDQFMPWAVTPSGSAGSLSVSVQPSAYYYDNQFRWAGGTGIAGFENYYPTGSSNARMLLIYLDPDTGNPYIATGTLTEFANTITGTQQIMPYMPSLIEETDIPLAGVRLITGTSKILWQNLYDLRDYFAHASVSGSSGGGGAPTDASYVVMGLNGTLSDERVLTAGSDITLADGGAGGNATVGVATGTFSRAGHGHLYPYSVAIYEDDAFVATGTIIDFGTNVNVAVTGSVVYVSTVDTTGGGGGDLLIYDDSVFSVTGTAISFDDNLTVHVTGSIAYIEGIGATGTAGPPGESVIPIYDDSVFVTTGTAISFDNALNVHVTGSVAYINSIPNWFNVEDFGAVHDGVTDDTTAIQDTIDAADSAGGGVVYFPAGIYIVGGALQDTGRANAQLLLPTKDVETDDAISITFLGEYAPIFNVALITTPGTDFLSGSIIKGTLNAGAGGALIGGMSTVASSYDFTRITARFENITFRMPDNPVLSALNLTNVSVAEIDKCAFDVGAVTDVPDVTEPTTATSFALQTPDESNGAHTSLNNIRIVGYYNGIKIGEHCIMDNIHITGCKYAFVASADVGVHPWYGKRLLIQHCPYGLTISDECYFEIEQLAIEHYDASPSTWYDPVYDLNDASNLGTGIIRYKSTLANAATRDELIINGASGITVLGIDEATNPTLSYWEPAVDADGDDIMFNSDGDIAMVWIV